ncbi:hypothetical protein IRJ41_012213 [Triplophysa rosa]|uniref:Uncharacterized protein n=1 Tax=Triplophysa rosa TaxID=992332 RepID=A0A9W7TDJ8_TRIRA|nr:hypothetical protein IRJ41_012213 [Triplophysa rosa]
MEFTKSLAHLPQIRLDDVQRLADKFSLTTRSKLEKGYKFFVEQYLFDYEENDRPHHHRRRQVRSSRGKVTFKVKDEDCIEPEREDLQLKHHQTLLSAHNQRVLATEELQKACVREATLPLGVVPLGKVVHKGCNPSLVMVFFRLDSRLKAKRFGKAISLRKPDCDYAFNALGVQQNIN